MSKSALGAALKLDLSDNTVRPASSLKRFVAPLTPPCDDGNYEESEGSSLVSLKVSAVLCAASGLRTHPFGPFRSSLILTIILHQHQNATNAFHRSLHLHLHPRLISRALRRRRHRLACFALPLLHQKDQPGMFSPASHPTTVTPLHHTIRCGHILKYAKSISRSIGGFQRV